MPTLIVSCYAVFSECPWEACSFVKGSGGGVHLGEKENGAVLGGGEEGETVVRMY